MAIPSMIPSAIPRKMSLIQPLHLIRFCSMVTVLSIGTVTLAEVSEVAQPVDFNSQIRPILTQHCTSCHGGVKAAGDVSFIYAERVLPPDGWVIEPGDAEASVLMERITTDDPDIRMPPPEEHPHPLPSENVALIRRWIEEGAKWDAIWSIAPLDSSLAATTPTSSWSRQPLDNLVHSRIIANGLLPSPESSPSAWLRRASFDLTGLPPNLEQTNAFLRRLESAHGSHSRELVYQSEVDRLLASNRFGERWASVWMDLARYADSQGFEKDPHRDMWPYRDWLIDAFNRDMPYDEFTIKQLAGDLVPNRTADDLIATAFHRNTMTNTEGGTDDEEFRIAAVIDRINTTWTVWQATTMGCVQCHSHPYDALEHDEFYAAMALFNSTADADLPNDYPLIHVPRDPNERESAFAAFEAYEQARHHRNELGWNVTIATTFEPIKPLRITTTSGKMRIDDHEIVADGGTFTNGVTFELDASTELETIAALQIQISPSNPDPLQWPEQGSVLTQLQLSVVDKESLATEVPIADVFVDAITTENDPRDAIKPNGNGVGGFPKLHGPRRTVFVLAEPLALPPGSKLRLSMTQAATVSGNISTPLRRFDWSASDHPRWQELLVSDELCDATRALARSQKRFAALKGANLPIVWSLPDSKQRTTRQFVRGNWLEKTDEVAPAIPAVFNNNDQVSTDEINDRLKFATWLVSEQNPLAARVWANRIWQQLFGIGIVETLEDFGSSGLLPVHGELLDHLAIRLREKHRWHLKPMLRELVLSSTYRQSNESDLASVQADPANRLLARGPRTRLSAEMVRDQALSVAGLLSDEIGGPSVMPPQPDGIWASVYSNQQWVTAEGHQRYRRGLYTYWRRTSPYPSFLMFDSPTRDLCSARRIATNTPLQALVTLNDPVYVECSEALAKLAIESSDTPREAIDWMARATTQNELSHSEADEILTLYRDLAPANHDETKSMMDPHAMSIVANTLLNWDKALTK